MKTTLIIPAKGKPKLLLRSLLTLFNSGATPNDVIIVIDDCQETYSFIVNSSLVDYPVNILVNKVRLGFWGSLARAIEKLNECDLFFYFGQDSVFMPDWYKHAMQCYCENFKNGVGLMSFRDDIHNHGNASHGATTKRTLKIVWNHPYPPKEYDHFFCDSELSAKCTDLGIRFYSHDAYVKHMHTPLLRDIPRCTPDYEIKEDRMKEWYKRGLDFSRERIGVYLD